MKNADRAGLWLREPREACGGGPGRDVTFRTHAAGEPRVALARHAEPAGP